MSAGTKTRFKKFLVDVKDYYANKRPWGKDLGDASGELAILGFQRGYHQDSIYCVLGKKSKRVLK